jgi:drug/metabolite transporter (DMT)-like permease
VTPVHERAGLAFAGLCALNGAFVPAVAKLTTDRAGALFVGAATTVFAGATALVVLAARRELGVLLHRRIGPSLVAVGTIGTGAAFWLFFLGAGRATAIETTLCLQVEPAYALVAAWLVLGERPTARRLGATALILVGIGLALGAHGSFAPGAGVWPLLATPLCWQLSHLIVVRRLGGVPPAVLTGARYVHGGVVLGAAWALGGAAPRLAPGTSLPALLPLVALQGVVLAYCGTMLWYEAITRLDLARTTAIVVPSTPVLSLVATFLLVGERPSPAQWAGVLLTAAGVLAFVTAPHALSTRPRVPIWTAPIAAPRVRRRS